MKKTILTFIFMAGIAISITACNVEQAGAGAQSQMSRQESVGETSETQTESSTANTVSTEQSSAASAEASAIMSTTAPDTTASSVAASTEQEGTAATESGTAALVGEKEATSTPVASVATHMDWATLMQLPTEKEVSNFQPAGYAPYISIWMDADRYAAYITDFRADYQPEGTYLCTGTFALDYSELKSQYTQVWQDYDGISGYFGFQRLGDGTRCAILSFWNIYCKDQNGKEHTIQPALLYPEKSMDDGGFGGEGTGVHCLVPYEWQEGKWYRTLLSCLKSKETGNMTVQMWVCELESVEWTKLVEFDTGMKAVCFTGDIAAFLENFDDRFAGEIRTMEMKNCRIRPSDGEEWINIDKFSVQKNSHSGSYNYGATGDTLWVITTGLPDRCQLPGKMDVQLTGSQKGSP